MGNGEGREADGQALEDGRLQAGKAKVEANVEVAVGGSQDRCWRSRQSSKVPSWGNLNQEHQLTNKLIFFGGTRCRSVGRQLDNELEVTEEEPGVVELEGEGQEEEDLQLAADVHLEGEAEVEGGDGGQVVHMVGEQEVVVDEMGLGAQDRCWSSRQSSRVLGGGSQGLGPQETSSGYQGGDGGNRLVEEELHVGRSVGEEGEGGEGARGLGRDGAWGRSLVFVDVEEPSLE